MAGDDEVVIKISADLAAAMSSLEGLKDQFDTVLTGLKQLAAQAEASGESTAVYDKAIQALATTIDTTLTAANEKIVAAVTEVGATAIATIGHIEAVKVVTETFGVAADVVAEKLGLVGEGVTAGMAGAGEAMADTTASAADLSDEFNSKLTPSVAMAEGAFGPLFTTMEQGGKAAADGLGPLPPIINGLGEATAAAAGVQQSFFDVMDQGSKTTYGLIEAAHQLAAARMNEQATYAGFSDQQKKSTAELTQALLEQGMKIKDVAAAAGLSVEALKLLNAEQADLKKKTEAANEAAKPFWENWLTGAKGGEVATVAFGVLVADVFKQIGSLAMEAAVAFPEFIKGMANAGDEMKTMAQRLGTTTSAIAEMKYIGEQAGVSTETMARAMQGFSASLTDSGSKASQAIRGLGLSMSELKNLSDTDQLRVIVDRIKELPPNIDKGAKMMEVFGAKARLMTQLVGEDIGQLQQDFKDLGGAENQEALGEMGDTFNDLSNNIKVASESFQRSIAVVFLPGINAVLEKVPLLGGAVLTLGGAFTDLASSMMPMIGTWALMTTSDKGLAGLTGAFEGAGGKIKKFGSDLLKLGTSIKANLIPNLVLMASSIWTTTVALLASPLTWIAVAIVAVGVALYKMAGGWEGISKAMEPVIEFFEDMVLIGKTLAESVFADLVRWVNELITSFQSLFSSTGQGMSTLQGLITWAEEWITWLEQFPIIGDYIRLVKAEIDLLWGAAKSLYDWVVKFGGSIVGWFKAVKDEAHETAEGIRQQDAMFKQASKSLEDQKKAKEALAAGSKKEQSNLDKMAAKVDYLNSAYTSLSAAEKAAIVAGEKAGLSSKEIAEDLRKTLYHGVTSVEDATKIVDRYKDKLKEAEAEAKKNPFKKLMDDAIALSKALDLAAKAQIPLTEQIDEYGKKASEIAQKAAMRGELEKIPPKVVEIGRAWEQAQLATLMEKTNTKATELARTFNEKVTTASAEASAAIVAMQGAITESALRGTELRLAIIEREKQASLTANAEKARQADVFLASQRDKEWELAQQRIEDIKKTEGSISAERQAAIMVETAARIAGYNAQNEALKAKLEDEAAIIKMNSERQRMIAEGDLAYFEEVMKERGQITKVVLAEQLATETKTLELMKIKHTEFSTFQIEEQARRVAALADLGEKEAKERGLITKTAMEIELAIQKSNLEYMKANRSKFYDWEIQAAEANVAKLTSIVGQEAKKRGLETKAEVTERVRVAKDNLAFMIANEKDFTKKQIEEGKLRVRQAEEDAGKIRLIWAQNFKKMASAGSAIGGVFEEIGRQGHEGMAKVGKAVTAASEIMGDVGGLLEAKDTIGMVIAAAKLAVTAIKAMWDAFSKSPGEDIVGRVGQRMGVVIGEEMGDTIAKTAKDKFKGDRFAAEVFHLSDIVEAAGGITEKNFEKLLGGLRDTFVMLEKKMFTVEQARESLDKNFGVFADHVVKSGKVASAAFVEMIRLNKELGVNSKEVAAFVSGQAASLGTAFEKLVSPQLVASEDSKEVIKGLRDEWTKTDQAIGKMKLMDKDGQEVYKDLSKMTKEQKAELHELEIVWDRQKVKLDAATASQAKMAAQAMPALDRAGRLMTATFNAALSSGVGFTEAIDQMGPGLDSVLKTMENLGIEVEDSSVSWIVNFRNRINANRELVDSAGSLNDIMLGMSNIGALNEDSMKDLEAQGLDSFKKLTDAGFQENEALKMMAGFLTTTRDAHAQMGIPIDENTASLIKQAEEAGIIKEQQLDTNKIMMEGLGAIIEAVGGKLPAAWKTAQEAASDSAKTIAEDVDKTVNETIEDQEKLLKEQEKAWADEAKAADRAALAMKRSMEKVDKSIDGVQDGLDDTDWDGWAREAIDAAEDVEGAVTGVAEGHSPGGIKEIPIRLAQAREAFKIWERVGVTSAENLQDTIDSMRGRDLGMAGIRSAGVPTQMPSGEFVRQIVKDEAETSNAPVNLTFNITSMDPAGVELVTERKILPAMVKILRRGRNLADMQTVLNLKG